MKNWLFHILLLAGLFGMLTTSCTQEEALEPQNVSEEMAKVVFTIDFGSSNANSRGGLWGDNYDDDTQNNYDSAIGSEFDNYINPEQFYVEIVVGNSSQPVHVQNIEYKKIGDNRYEFIGEVEEAITNADAKIFVYANMSKDANGTIPTSFSTDYTSASGFPGTGVEYIPMWGVQSVNLTLIPGFRVVLDDPIYLLRAMAKIELTLTEALVNDGYTLNGVTIKNYNSTGNLIPTGEYGYTTQYLREECINVSSAQYSDAGLPFYKDSDNHYWIYVPEFLVNKNDAIQANNDLQIKIDLSKGTKKLSEDRSTFSMFETSLVRNHWYKYTIISADMEDKLSLGLEYQVMEWTKIENGALNFGNANGNVFQ